MADGVEPAPRARARRVFLGPVEIAGYYRNLQAGLAELGVQATVVDLTDHPFQYAAARQPPLVRLTSRAFQARLAVPPGQRVQRIGRLAVETVLRAALFVWAVARFDVFVFSFGSTLLALPALELPLLRRLGKTIVTVHHGSDSRPPYLDGSLMATDRGRTTGDCVRLARVTKARVAALDRHAHWVVENPLSSHFHERTCVNWFALGVPYVERTATDGSAPSRTGAGVRIVHSPSHPEAKGTERIREAIDRLAARGRQIEFVQLTGRPHAEVARELMACDFVVDQLYSDTPMAGFATEAAHYGKPTVVAGYAGEEFRRVIAPEMMPPTEYCHPDRVEEAIERLVVDREYRVALGRRAQEFVRARWSRGAVASAYLRLFEGRVPAEWLFDPRETTYVHGGALAERRARELIARVVELSGPEALHVSDKPALERRLLEFAMGGAPSAPALPAVAASSAPEVTA